MLRACPRSALRRSRAGDRDGVLITIVHPAAVRRTPSSRLLADDLLACPRPRNVVNIVNHASVIYLSALAAAIGFRMSLFNIGVEGQYRVAVFAAAAFAGGAGCPAR